MDRNMIGMCGAYCGVCQWKPKTHCPGCQSAKGKLFWGQCAVALCAADKALEHCGQCPDLPCRSLQGCFDDPEHGDSGERLANLRAWSKGESICLRLQPPRDGWRAVSTSSKGHTAGDCQTAPAIITERLLRQCLLRPATGEKRWLELFRSLQPVSPVAYSRPGDPPGLRPRTRSDDAPWANRLRRDRRIVKGRFQGGTVAYVLADDLALYANAFRRPLDRVSAVQAAVMEAVRQQGPISARQLRAETGLLSKRIGPALQRLQEAFLVYEDQVDDGWDRPWYDFSTEWPSVPRSDGAHVEAVAIVLDRFLWAHVFATFGQIADWSGLRKASLTEAVGELEIRERIRPMAVDGLGQGWAHSEALGLRASPPPEMVAMLHRADFLVRSHGSELARRFAGREVLQYLLVDGAFLGAVLGHWRIGPHDVEDIVVELPAAERQHRKQAILAEVRRCYGGSSHPIRRYAGKRL